MRWVKMLPLEYFNPLSLYRERRSEIQHLDIRKEHFNPLSLYRERQKDRAARKSWQHFNPLSLYRERRLESLQRLMDLLYFNPLSLYRERRTGTGIFIYSRRYFNPLSLYRERRDVPATKNVTATFQSTLPIQGETIISCCYLIL